MLSREAFNLKIYAKKSAWIMYKSGDNLPDEIKNIFVAFESMDYFHDFSYNCTRVFIAEYLRLFMQENKIKFIKCELINSDNLIRNSNIYQYTFEMPDNQKVVIVSLNQKCLSAAGSMYSLSDSMYSYYIESGCCNCQYSDTGCDFCGMNKARKKIHDSEILTFKKTCKPFMDLLGDKLKPLENFIKYSIEYEKNHEKQNDDLMDFDDLIHDDDDDDEEQIDDWKGLE